MALDRFFLLDRRSIPWLDGLRAIAIVLVVAQHVHDFTFGYLSGTVPFSSFDALWLKLLTGYGWSGVELFFVISGFLVGGSIIIEIHSGSFRWHIFAFKRFFRVYVPAVVFLAAYGLTKPLSIFPEGNIISHFSTWGIHNLLLIMNYTGDGLLGHYWSLAVEEHFYITLPIVALCFAPMIRRYPLRIIGQSFLGAALIFALFRLIVMQTLHSQRPGDYFQLSHWQFDFFAMGIALRIYYENGTLRSAYIPALRGVVLLLGFFATLMALSLFASISEGNNLFVNHGINDKIDGVMLFMNLVVMSMLVFLSSSSTAGRILSSKWLRVVAAISFSTYIVHLVVITRTEFIYLQIASLGQGHTISYILALIVGLCTTLGAGLLFFIAIERPVLIFRDLLVEKWRRPLPG